MLVPHYVLSAHHQMQNIQCTEAERLYQSTKTTFLCRLAASESCLFTLSCQLLGTLVLTKYILALPNLLIS